MTPRFEDSPRVPFLCLPDPVRAAVFEARRDPGYRGGRTTRAHGHDEVEIRGALGRAAVALTLAGFDPDTDFDGVPLWRWRAA